jgi:serine/threonine-protein kinase HipA
MDIFVYIDAFGLTDGPLPMGILKAETVRGKQIFSFRADESWLKNNCFNYLDPDLQQYSGVQYAPGEKGNFGLFLDSCPDRWGRVLMQRRERIRAKEAGEGIKKLQESDYLLGIYDGNRMGALRFKTDRQGKFLDDDAHLATPPVTSLRALEQASLNYERTDLEQSVDYVHWVRMLYSPGSSLGGARPKANVVDTDGNLWIAKFPSKNDTIDVGAWEYIVTEMARKFGLQVPEVRIEKFSSCHHTFLTKRFDRQGLDKRLYFASAMTLLGYNDGDNAQDGVSYLELAEFIQNNGTPQLKDDLKELWKRVVFNIAISNCDDHLRNHGFILTSKGWTLSPAYDLTPNPDGLGLKLNISEDDNSLDYQLAIDTASYYGIKNDEAEKMVQQVKNVCSGWRLMTESISGLSRAEQERMTTAFRF